VVPELNQKVSARDLWGQVSSRAGEVCVESLEAAWRYGLNYYSVTPLPECSERPTAWRVRQEPGKPPHLDAGSPGAGAGAWTGARATVDPLSRNVVTSTLWK
jgi:hypothetical protein